MGWPPPRMAKFARAKCWLHVNMARRVECGCGKFLIEFAQRCEALQSHEAELLIVLRFCSWRCRDEECELRTGDTKK